MVWAKGENTREDWLFTKPPHDWYDDTPSVVIDLRGRGRGSTGLGLAVRLERRSATDEERAHAARAMVEYLRDLERIVNHRPGPPGQSRRQ